MDVLAVMERAQRLHERNYDEPWPEMERSIEAVLALILALNVSPCYCEEADGDGDAVLCDRCTALAKVAI